MSREYIAHGRDRANTIKSQIFNYDNGAGVTIDETLLVPRKQIKLLAARMVEDTETAGTVAAGSIGLGITVGGVEIVAATNYVNTSTVGTVLNLTILKPIIPGGTPIIARHTGVAATAAGQGHVELEYMEF